jgi:hypothetical protein
MTIQTSDPARQGVDLTALSGLHVRIGDGVGYLQGNCRKPARFDKGRIRLKNLYVLEYLPELRILAAIVSEGLLRAMRAAVERALEAGSRSSKRGPRVDDRYLELLRQYEILTDALRLADPDPRQQPWERLKARIATYTPTEEATS